MYQYEGFSMNLTAESSSDKGCHMFVGWYIQSTERNECYPIILVSAKLPCKFEREIKTDLDKQKMRHFITTGPVL